MTFDDFYDYLLNLCDKLSHRNEELELTIEDLQNDLKQVRNENKLLNTQIDRHITAVNDLTDIRETSHKVIDELKKENENLKNEIKTLYSLKNQLADDNNNLRAIIKAYETLYIKGVNNHDRNY